MKLIKQLFFFIIFIVVVFLIYCLVQFPMIESMENMNIPKKIWTFWDSEEIPPIVQKCIDSWRTHNPDFQIIVLNKDNVYSYLPEFPVNLKHGDNPAHFSDMVRINILAKYGGIWSDASIICYGSYEWILKLQKEKEVEFIGYWINNDTEDFPVIENWFFAAIPESNMMIDWKNELMKSQEYEEKEYYIDYLKSTCNLEHIDDPNYLWMHAALQKILQENKGKYKYEVFSAHTGPFKFVSDNNWHHKDGIDSLIHCNKKKTCKDKYGCFVKLTGELRMKLEEMDYEELFK